LWTNQFRTTSSTTIAMKPVIASSRGPSGDAALSSACTTNHVSTLAPNATRAPATTGRRRRLLAPRKLAVTAAKIRTASSPSRKTMIAEFATIVARLCGELTSVGSTGPVFAVAIR
jgi:hypothetical protein